MQNLGIVAGSSRRPIDLKIGNGTINNVKDTLLARGYAGSKILYVSDKAVDSIYGEIVRSQIREVGNMGKEFVDYNSIAYSMSIAERVIATDINLIVAMGGGKVLDVCKYASYVSKTSLLSIPTTAANDGLASPIAVLKRQDDKPKSLECAVPPMLLIDLDVIVKSPPELIKAGIGDTISNYTALMDWQMACERGRDTMNGYAFLMSHSALEGLLKTRYSTFGPDFIEVLINSLVMSGIAMDFAGSSRPASGSEHLFSHALDYYSPKKNLHGLQVALGTVATLKLGNFPENEVIDFLRQHEVDVNPLSLGIDESTFILCMQKATSMRKNRYTHLHELDLSTSHLKQVYADLIRDL